MIKTRVSLGLLIAAMTLTACGGAADTPTSVPAGSTPAVRPRQASRSASSRSAALSDFFSASSRAGG